MQITGAELFVKALLAERVDTLFAYPGGQAIDLFNALYGVEGLDVILPRHEQGLVHAADGYARSTGKVGVCLVTSGPGATNLVTGIATANYDSVPLVCFTGQVPTHLIGNDAFQEVDIVGITRSISKYAVTVRRREDLGAVIKKAFYIAKSGKPGVVVVDLPKDIQQELGSYAANTAISECDVLYSIGVRFNDRITGKVSEFAKRATIIHVDIDPASISRNIEVHIPIVADAKNAITALLEKTPEFDFSEWRFQIDEWKKQKPLEIQQVSASGVTPLAMIQKINQIFSEAVITTDVGQNQLWTTQFLELTNQKRLLTSGGLGTMGYGLPAALGAKLGNPGKDVIAICGDGGIQMNIQEMATAIVYELPVIICILNNGYLGNVRQWQEMFFDKRYSSTCLRYRRSCTVTCNTPSACCPEYTPDFVRLAESYGAKAIRVRKKKEIETVLLTAKNTKKVPTVIEFMIEREENVLPIVPPGNPLSDMIMGGNE